MPIPLAPELVHPAHPELVDIEHKGPRCAQHRGFSLHANVAVPARDRKRLEHLCRYVARPPIATERLTALPDGKLRYGLRKPWRDGTRGFVFTPDELIEKLVALTPPPQFNMMRYHGVLAPASKLRSRVVRDRRPRQSPSERPGELEQQRRRTSGFAATARTPWADLLKRVFALDVLDCPRCHGRMKVIATVTEPKAVAKFLEAIDENSEPPPIERARPPPFPDLWDEVDAPHPDDFHSA